MVEFEEFKCSDVKSLRIDTDESKIMLEGVDSEDCWIRAIRTSGFGRIKRSKSDGQLSFESRSGGMVVSYEGCVSRHTDVSIKAGSLTGKVDKVGVTCIDAGDLHFSVKDPSQNLTVNAGKAMLKCSYSMIALRSVFSMNMGKGHVRLFAPMGTTIFRNISGLVKFRNELKEVDSKSADFSVFCTGIGSMDLLK